MASNKKFKNEEVLEALKGSYGIITNVAKDLSCNVATVRKYIKESPELTDAFESERNEILDLAENGLIKLLKADDPYSIRWTLSTLGKGRGYTEKKEVEQVGTINMKIRVEDAGSGN